MGFFLAWCQHYWKAGSVHTFWCMLVLSDNIRGNSKVKPLIYPSLQELWFGSSHYWPFHWYHFQPWGRFLGTSPFSTLFQPAGKAYNVALPRSCATCIWPFLLTCCSGPPACWPSGQDGKNYECSFLFEIMSLKCWQQVPQKMLVL